MATRARLELGFLHRAQWEHTPSARGCGEKWASQSVCLLKGSCLNKNEHQNDQCFCIHLGLSARESGEHPRTPFGGCAARWVPPFCVSGEHPRTPLWGVVARPDAVPYSGLNKNEHRKQTGAHVAILAFPARELPPPFLAKTTMAAAGAIMPWKRPRGKQPDLETVLEFVANYLVEFLVDVDT